MLFATAAVIAAAISPAFAADPTPPGAARVTVRMSRPEAFIDFKATCVGIDARTRGLLDDLTQFIRATGARYVPDSETLEITLTDIDMAGEFETWRGPQACNVRVMLDIYAPRIRLEFRLIDRDGKVVSSGARDLRHPLYLTRAGLLSTDPLRYEKYVLLEWFQREFPASSSCAPRSTATSRA